MIHDKLPAMLMEFLPQNDKAASDLIFESTSAADGTIGSAWLVVTDGKIFVFSAPPLDIPKPVSKFAVSDVSFIKAVKNILGDIQLNFSLKANKEPVVFVIPCLLANDWPQVSAKLAKIFGEKFSPDVEDASFGSGSIVDASSGTALAEIQTIQFHPIEEIRIDSSPSVSSFGAISDSLPLKEEVKTEKSTESFKPQVKQAVEAFAKQKRKSQTTKINLLQTSEQKTETAQEILCPVCGRKNSSEYTYCLGCGKTLDPNKERRRRSVGNPNSYGYSSKADTQDAQATSCIMQLFYFFVGIGALLFFIAIGK